MERIESGEADTSSQVKVLAVASAGGHWVQLTQLAAAWSDMDVTYATTSNGHTPDAYSTEILPDANLDDKLGLVKLAWVTLRLIRRVRPDVVVSTGAAPGFFAIVFAKVLLGAKTVWVDSVANAERMSVSGRWVKRFADEWLVQWPDLAATSGASFKGSVL